MHNCMRTRSTAPEQGAPGAAGAPALARAPPARRGRPGASPPGPRRSHAPPPAQCGAWERGGARCGGTRELDGGCSRCRRSIGSNWAWATVSGCRSVCGARAGPVGFRSPASARATSRALPSPVAAFQTAAQPRGSRQAPLAPSCPVLAFTSSRREPERAPPPARRLNGERENAGQSRLGPCAARSPPGAACCRRCGEGQPGLSRVGEQAPIALQ